MNHLCNSHCEFCGDSIIEKIEEGQERDVFSILLVNTEGKVPSVIDYGFQSDFSPSLCSICAQRLLASDETNYSWKRCHCCGLNVRKEDISAFRITELKADTIEQHIYQGHPYEFISGDTSNFVGAIGFTVCMNCVLPELSCADSGEEVLPAIIKEAIAEGDVYEDYSDLTSLD